MTTVTLEFSQSDVRVIENQIKEEAYRRVKSGKLWPAMKHYPIEIHILRGIAFSVRVDAGAVVHMYITGVNFYGGDYSVLDKEFWKAMVRAIEVVPKMYSTNALVAPSSVASITLREVRENMKRWKVTKGYLPGLWVDPKKVEQISIKGTAQFKDKISGLTVTIPFTNDTWVSIHKTATIKLSELWLDKNKDTEIEPGEEGPYYYPPGV